MDLALKLYDERQAGMKKGREEGVKVGIQEAALNMINELRKERASDGDIQHNLHRFFGKQLSDQEINQLIKKANIHL